MAKVEWEAVLAAMEAARAAELVVAMVEVLLETVEAY